MQEGVMMTNTVLDAASHFDKHFGKLANLTEDLEIDMQKGLEVTTDQLVDPEQGIIRGAHAAATDLSHGGVSGKVLGDGLSGAGNAATPSYKKLGKITSTKGGCG
ncbi:hypothetical protein [Burkholderia pyrrocinia]|uniref:hypothetical protein n=1 Tax=Burkholderia pyrrocinia TaxID=60550 RepID=UPI0030D00F34